MRSTNPCDARASDACVPPTPQVCCGFRRAQPPGAWFFYESFDAHLTFFWGGHKVRLRGCCRPALLTATLFSYIPDTHTLPYITILATCCVHRCGVATTNVLAKDFNNFIIVRMDRRLTVADNTQPLSARVEKAPAHCDEREHTCSYC